MSGGRGGFTLLWVLPVLMLLGTAAATWQATARAVTVSAARGVARAQARALAEDAWARTRWLLEDGRGGSWARSWRGGHVFVEVEGIRLGRVEVVILAEVPRGDEQVGWRLEVEAVQEPGGWRVVERREGRG